jgi:soluble cytochrome b562
VVVNSALKAAETAHKVEAMKDKVTSLNTATNNNKPSQSPSPSPMKNARQKSHLDRFESAHERF